MNIGPELGLAVPTAALRLKKNATNLWDFDVSVKTACRLKSYAFVHVVCSFGHPQSWFIYLYSGKMFGSQVFFCIFNLNMYS